MTKQSIPSISNGLVELESDAVFELDSPKGFNWLESATSFRFIPTDSSAPYTARKESGKGGDYWYGYRKVGGKLHKRYIGKTADLTTAKLEGVASALDTPLVSRQSGVTGTVTQAVTDKVTDKVTQAVTDKVTDAVTQTVTDRVTDTRISTLEEQIKALQESVKALQDILREKTEGLSYSPELLKPGTGVTDSELQTVIGNLESENETLKQELRSQNRQLEDQDKELLQLHERNGDLDLEVQNLKEELATAGRDRDEIKNLAPAVADFPEPADLLNQLKARRKKSIASLADIEVILELLSQADGLS